ncbi:MAG TPA: suppressor of fused domain protein [Planctomycetota bacterium]|nr:suppressor of fused domain protein [Planctomycetota bacterium]
MADDDERSPGWQAIDAALKSLYPEEKPQHFGVLIPYDLGGPDPLRGLSAYRRADPEHWHFVSYGFTELFAKESPDKETSGFGFELTFRLARPKDEDKPPAWALNFLQNLGRYVFQTGNAFGVGHHMSLNGPIAQGSPTEIRAIAFAADSELGEFSSGNGRARFLQVVGLTEDELALAMDWNAESLLKEMRGANPLLLTDLGRKSVLQDEALAKRLHGLAGAEGSSMGEQELDDGRFLPGPPFVWELGAMWVNSLLKGLRGRILHRRPFGFTAQKRSVEIAPADRSGFEMKGTTLSLKLTPGLASAMLFKIRPLRGDYQWPELPGFLLRIVPTDIKGHKGEVINTIG